MVFATQEQIREIERRAINGGLSEGRLMENAGAAAAKHIRDIAGEPKNTVVLCGNGNNGGDGFVIARKLAENGYTILERKRDFNDRERAVLAQYGRKDENYGN